MSKKVLHKYFIAFLSCSEQFLLWKHFIAHHIALSEKRKREGDQVLFKNYFPMCLPKFGNYQGKEVTNYDKEQHKLLMFSFSKEKDLSDVRSEIHHVWC